MYVPYTCKVLLDSTLTENRPTKKTSCSMRHTPSIQLLWSAPWRSKESGNRSGYGTTRFKRFCPETMKLQRTKRPRSKTANEMRPRSAPMTESNGILGFSVASKVDLVDRMRVKKTSTGSSMLKCKKYCATPKDYITDSPSDMHDPQVATKQILSIAPILQGQKESSQYQIPPHHPNRSAPAN